MDVSPWIVKRKRGESGLYYWRKGVKIWSFAENSDSVKNRSAGLRQRYTSAHSNRGQMALLLNQRLGPYEILSALGAGGMGEVYRARDTRLDRIVAIKILSDHIADRPGLRERSKTSEQGHAAAGKP